MQRYLVEALPLGKAAVGDALAAAERRRRPTSACSRSVRAPATSRPGLDILLARDLGLPADAQRLFIGHMGCYAALPGLGVGRDYVAAATAGRPCCSAAS